MHLHLDCFAGISGDMLLGALVDLGASPEVVVQELEKLGLDGWSVTFPGRDAGHGMQGVGVEVSSHELSSAHRGHAHDEELEAAEPDPMHDTQEHDPVVPYDLPSAGPVVDPNETLEWQDVAVEAVIHEPEHAPQAHRSYSEIVELIAGAGLTVRAERRAQNVFRRIAKAEARVHGLSIEDVHFHEVGAIDSIIDVVGAAIALDLLDVTTISATPVPLGYGFTESQHGRIPIPAPATIESLQGVPCFDSGLDVELVTPTGAGFIGALATRFVRFPDLVIEKVGYGAGTRRHADRPNILRAVLGTRPADAPLACDEVWELAANIDDQSAESLAFAIEAIWEVGAVDVWTVPIVMKKGRLGHLVTCLVPAHRREAGLEAILRHTTSLGVRMTRHERAKLVREVATVETQYGAIGVKVGRGLDGQVWNVAPEADDCAEAAARAGIPVKLVYQAALAQAVERLL